MPATTTHNLFAKDVLKKLDNKSQNMIKNAIDFYAVFAQSFDNFFHYNYLGYKKAKAIRDFGHYCHKSNTQSYMINIIRNIQKLKLENNPQAIAYLYGSICHYVLDSMCHPFIFYKTGIFKKGDKSTYKYSSKHTYMKFMLDSYMYTAKTGKPFYKYKFWDELNPKLKPSLELIEVINKTYKDTYNKDNMAKYYFKSNIWTRRTYKIFCYDKTGFKKSLYKIFDKFTPESGFKAQDISFYIKSWDITYLNINHQTWNHPANQNIKYNYSFIDLYNNAIDKTVEIIKKVNLVLYKNYDIKSLLEVIENISYSSGLPITENKKMKYFEY